MLYLPKELYLTAFATMLAIIVYNMQMFYVIKARTTYGIKAPATTGNENFDRVWRVHYNTLEQLPIFFASLWLFALTVSSLYAGILGILWSIGRLGYMYGYYKSTKSRSNPIAYVGSFSFLILSFGSLIAVIMGFFR